MDRVVLTTLCSAAIALAVAIVVRWGGLDSSFRAEEAGIGSAVRRLCVLEVSGLLAGLLVGGLGSRLMMRIMAATSSAAAQGQVTQADEIVGRVTADGTIGLLIFVGAGFGIIGAALLAAVGRFLPKRAWVAGGAFGLLLLGVFARRDPLDPGNRDFEILSPVALAVAMIAVLFVLYGMTVVSLSARLERSYPHLEARARSLVMYVPLLLLVLPPFTLAIAAGVGVGAFGERFSSMGEAWRSRTTGLVGATVVALATVGSIVWLGFGVAEILS